ATASSEHNPSTIEEQQGLLQPEQPMSSNATKPENREGDASAKVIVWGAFALSTWVFHRLFQSLSTGSFTCAPYIEVVGLQRHQIVMICVDVPLILAGTGAILLQKNSHSAPHFTTWHGISTFSITATGIIVQALVGGSIVWFGGAAWGGGMKAKLVWKYHRLLGNILCPVLLFTAHLGGGWSFWSTGNSDSFFRLLAFSIAPFVILAGVYSRIR
ncbi:hypothetical protein L210DRAFT_3592833, partial [Boletus edulis BED1]